jgi:hypothetical protein
MKWISEAEQLPKIAQEVLLAVPRQGGEFWDLKVAQLLVRHEDVAPHPVKTGSRWPVDWWWSWNRDGGASVLVTGNSWWALLDDIPLPPGAEHKTDRGFHYIAQPKRVWVSGD